MKNRTIIFQSLSAVLLIGLLISACEEDEVPKLELVSITGLIMDDLTSKSIAGASVSLVDQELDDQLTGADGSFRFSELRLDDATYELLISHQDYDDLKSVVTIEEGKQKDTLSLAMTPAESLEFGGVSLLDFGSGANELDLIVTNVSSISRSITISFEDDWLTVDDNTISISSGNKATVSVSVSRDNLEVGNFESSIIFSVEDGLEQSIPVKLQKLDPASAILSVNKTSIDLGKATTTSSLVISNLGESRLNWTASESENWLSLSATSGAIEANGNVQSIAVTVDRDGLEAGTYEGSIAFDGNGGTATVGIKMEVDPLTGLLTVSKSSLDFGKETSSDQIILSNEGTESLDWTTMIDGDWITIDNTMGTLVPTDQTTVEITVDRSSLTEGQYTGSVSFVANDESTTIFIAVEVVDGVLETDKSEIDFGLDDTFNESVIVLSNSGYRDLSWTASSDASWITVDQSSGSLSRNDEESVNIEIDRSTLAKGEHNGSVTFTAGEQELDISISVSILGGVLELSVSSMNFGASETNQFATLSNTGNRPLTWSASSNDSWLTFSPMSGSLQPDEESTLSVTVNRSGLNLGDYESQILFTEDQSEHSIEVYMSVEVDTDMDGVPDNVDADDDGDGLIEIFTIDDLYDVRYDLTADDGSKQGAPAGGFTGYELVNNLNFSNDSDYEDLTLKSEVASGSGWPAIGTSNNSFNTVFEGNGFVISELFINRTTEYNGLFRTTGVLAEIRNLRVEIRYLAGGNFTAGLIGSNRGDIFDCSVSGQIIGSAYLGLLIGRHREGIVERCFTEGVVDGSGSYVGGMIGSTGYNSSDRPEVNYSYSSAAVDAGSNTGGLVGGRQYASFSIQSCYATGTVNSTSYYVGGLVGTGNGIIDACYATGNVTTSYTNSAYIGGLVGTNSAIITASFSTGLVTAASSSRRGGLVGNGGANVTDTNYWDTQTSGQDTSAGGTGLTTTELQSPTNASGIYITWNPDDWDFGTSSQYPALKGMPGGIDAQR